MTKEREKKEESHCSHKGNHLFEEIGKDNGPQKGEKEDHHIYFTNDIIKKMSRTGRREEKGVRKEERGRKRKKEEPGLERSRCHPDVSRG